ncbi:MAG TPA: tetratricopeptide repeat protein, partial [Pyrinomonadaceae bacterium]|nr:tetratricopeptide repeat protein [Pyrinomonadaceae bacterium]HRK49567.1 tetratricopeptide repeat protein [Pyrinomonadaceae bacterium]
GEQYERKLSELLTTQREMVAEIVSKLQLKLSGESEQKLAKKYTDNNEAYQLYLQGRYHWNKREAKEFEKALEFFKQAIEKDTNYALAYSGLADTYSLFPAYGNFRPNEYMPQAKQAALKALEIDPNLAEAHASLGEAIFYYDYDWAGAEKAFKRAIELNPKYATARQWYGELLSLGGRQDEAIREMSKALELDPFSMIINRQMVSVLQQTKRFDEAFLQNKKINELFPNEEDLHFTNSTIFEAQGKYMEAFEELLLAEKAGGAKPEEIQETKNIYEKGGWEAVVKRWGDEQLKFLNDKKEKDKNEYVLAINYAYAYAYLKDKDKTIEYLNKAYDERSMAVLNLKVNYVWDFVRDDPRFKELVKRVGIPE